MTIVASCLSLTLGAWRVRLRFDIDEPREALAAPDVRAPRFTAREVHAARRHYYSGGHR